MRVWLAGSVLFGLVACGEVSGVPDEPVSVALVSEDDSSGDDSATEGEDEIDSSRITTRLRKIDLNMETLRTAMDSIKETIRSTDLSCTTVMSGDNELCSKIIANFASYQKEADSFDMTHANLRNMRDKVFKETPDDHDVAGVYFTVQQNLTTIGKLKRMVDKGAQAIRDISRAYLQYEELTLRSEKLHAKLSRTKCLIEKHKEVLSAEGRYKECAREFNDLVISFKRIVDKRIAFGDQSEVKQVANKLLTVESSLTGLQTKIAVHGNLSKGRADDIGVSYRRLEYEQRVDVCDKMSIASWSCTIL